MANFHDFFWQRTEASKESQMALSGTIGSLTSRYSYTDEIDEWRAGMTITSQISI